MKTEIELLKEQLNSISEQIKKLESKPDFEVGKWYFFKNDVYEWIAKFKELIDDKFHYYCSVTCNEYDHTGQDLMWCNNNYCAKWFYKGEATPDKIKSALIKEAERREYKKGVGLIYPWQDENIYYPEFTGDNQYNEHQDSLFYKGVRVCYKGKWAEIIKDKITICGKEVEFFKGSVRIDGVDYLEVFLKDLAANMKKGQIKSLNVGCKGHEQVTLDIINRIIEKLK